MDADNPRRRLALRSALALAGGLWLPFSLSGCESKPGATSAAGGVVTAPPVPQDAVVKTTQAAVKYQPQPKGAQKCANCRNYLASSNTCQQVDGQISPDGWCVIWTKQV